MGDTHTHTHRHTHTHTHTHTQHTEENPARSPVTTRFGGSAVLGIGLAAPVSTDFCCLKVEKKRKKKTMHPYCNALPDTGRLYHYMP